jgi:hypothetical protein
VVDEGARPGPGGPTDQDGDGDEGGDTESASRTRATPGTGRFITGRPGGAR